MTRNRCIRSAAVLACAAAFVWDGEASAQQWLTDRAAGQGRGIRSGDFEIHPGVGLEFGYDSNALFMPSGFEIPALRLRGTAHVSFATLSGRRAEVSTPPTLNFRSQIALTWQQFFAVPGYLDPNTARSVNAPGGTIGFNLEVFPQRTWQFVLYDDISRIILGPPDGAAAIASNRFENRGGFGVVYAPNSAARTGAPFDVRVNYENRLFYFEDRSVQYMSSDANEISLRTRWRFFPKTALFWEGMVIPTFFLGSSGMGRVNASAPIKTRLGLNGLFTDRIRVLIAAGYAGSYYFGGDNASTVIAQAEIQYLLDPLHSLSFGLLRDIVPSFIGNYGIRNALYGRFNQSFLSRFYVSTELNLAYLQVGDPNFGGGGTHQFNVLRFQGTVFGEYRPNDIFGINATLAFVTNQPDQNPVMLPGSIMALAGDYTQFTAFLGLRASW